MSCREGETTAAQRVKRQCVKYQDVMKQNVQDATLTNATVTNLQAQNSNVQTQTVNSETVQNLASNAVNATTLNAGSLYVNDQIFSPCIFPTPVTGPTTLTESGRYALCSSFTGKITIRGYNITLKLNSKNLNNDGDVALEIVDSNMIYVTGGSVTSSTHEAIKVTNSTNVHLSWLSTSDADMNNGGVAASSQALRRPWAGVNIDGSSRVTVRNYLFNNIRSYAVTANNTRTLELTQLVAQNITEMNDTAIVKVQNAQNVLLQQSSFDNIHALVNRSSSFIDFQQVTDSRITKNSIFNSRLGINTDIARKNRKNDKNFRTGYEKLNAMHAMQAAAIKIDENKISGVGFEKTGSGRLEAAPVAVEDATDTNVANNQIDDNFLVGDDEVALLQDEEDETILMGVLCERVTNGEIVNCQVNGTAILAGGGKESVVGINCVECAEIRDSHNTANSSYASQTTGVVDVCGCLHENPQGDAVIEHNQYNSNGEGAHLAAGYAIMCEDPTISFKCTANSSNGNTAEVLAAGCMCDANYTTFERCVANNNQPAPQEEFHAKPSEKVLFRIKNKMRKPGQRKARVLVHEERAALRAKSLAKFNVNQVQPTGAGIVLTGTENREQTSVTVNDCECMNTLNEEETTPFHLQFTAEEILANPDFHHFAARQAVAPVTAGVLSGDIELPNRRVRGSSRLAIRRGAFGNSTAGVSLRNVRSSQVSDISTKGNAVGIDLDGGANHTVERNVAIRNGIGSFITAEDTSLVENKIMEGQVPVLDTSARPSTLLSNKSVKNATQFVLQNGQPQQFKLNRDTGLFDHVTGDARLTALANIFS